MSLTYEQIEAVSDGLKNLGFDVSDLDNDQIALIAQCVLDALCIELVE